MTSNEWAARFDHRTMDELLAIVAIEDQILPVRAMEAVLRRGEEGVEPLVHALEEGTEARFENPVWPVVLLGELARTLDDPEAAVHALALSVGRHGLRDATTSEFWMALAASEALAKVGEPALPVLEELLAEGDEAVRTPSYAALGAMGTDRAVDRLLRGAEEDLKMADVVAQSLQDTGRREAVEPLHRLLHRCPPHFRIEVEEAIRGLHHGVAGSPPLALEDWRLRYRPWGRLGPFDPGWVGVSAIVRAQTQEVLERRHAPPLRPLEEIVAEPPDHGFDEVERECAFCGRPGQIRYGLGSCKPSHTGLLAGLQRDLLLPWAEEGESDLFTVLGDADHDFIWLDQELDARREFREESVDAGAGGDASDPDGGLDEDEEATLLHDWQTETSIVRETCRWFLERGVEDLPSALEELGERARRTDRPGHGLRTREPISPPEPAVGRNEPCPCGSGKKYKKCCGHPRRIQEERGPPDVLSPEMEPADGWDAYAGESFPGPGPGSRAGPGSGALPEILSPEGDPFLAARAHYRVSDASEVRRRLEAAEEFQADEEATEFTWTEPGDGLLTALPGARRILGSVRLAAEGLVLECSSERRLERGRRVLEALLGEAIVHRADTVQDPFQAAEEAGNPTRGQRAVEEEIPRETRRRLTQEFKDNYYRNWLDEPVPALAGLTPREASELVKGRRELERLLLEYEEAERRMEEREGFSYDFTWLWRELLLDRPDPPSSPPGGDRDR